MIDLYWKEIDLNLSILFFSLFVLYVAFFFAKIVKNPLFVPQKANIWLLTYSLLLIIVIVSSNESDWFHYQEMVWKYDLNNIYYNYGEPVYSYIVRGVNRNYLLFRIVVWGGSFFLTCLTFKRLNININIAIFFLVTVFLLKYNYSRSTLAMACYFYGLSFLIKPIKRFDRFDLIFTALLFWGAYSFHNSTLALIVLTIFAFLPLDKPYIITLVIIFVPTLAYLFSENLSLISNIDNEAMVNKLDFYLDKTDEKYSIFGLLEQFISYGSFFIPLIITTILVYKNISRINPIYIKVFRLTICIVIFAIVFLFMGFNTLVFFYRFLYMTFIPITILSVLFYQHRMMNKRWFVIMIIWGAVVNAYSLFHTLYKLI